MERVTRRLKVAGELHSLVRTMKALAAVGMRQYQHALESLALSRETLEFGLQAVLSRGVRLSPVGTGSVAAVVVGSDQGMCGSFNDRVSTLAASALPEDARVLVVGSRAAQGLPRVDRVLAIPSAVAGLEATTRQVLQQVEAWRAERITLFHNLPVTVGSFQARAVGLLPLDPAWLAALAKRPWGSRSLPALRGEPSRVLSALVHRWLMLELYGCLAQSLAAENGARLVAMQAAERSIEERRDELTRTLQELRQNAVTAELLDIVSGFEVVGRSK